MDLRESMVGIGSSVDPQCSAPQSVIRWGVRERDFRMDSTVSMTFLGASGVHTACEDSELEVADE